eukprot:jgi/Tetstr1/444888/TSEL_032726.t1
MAAAEKEFSGMSAEADGFASLPEQAERLAAGAVNSTEVDLSLMSRWLGLGPKEQGQLLDEEAARSSFAGAVVFCGLVVAGLLWLVLALRTRRRAYTALKETHRPEVEEPEADQESGADCATVDVNVKESPPVQQLTVYCTSSSAGTGAKPPLVSVRTCSPRSKMQKD